MVRFPSVFAASWFVYLVATGDHPFGLTFMASDHPSQPPGREAFDGTGLLLTLQVGDATAEFKRLKDGGVDIAYPLHVKGDCGEALKEAIRAGWIRWHILRTLVSVPALVC
jgi:hypothetical protein